MFALNGLSFFREGIQGPRCEAMVRELPRPARAARTGNAKDARRRPCRTVLAKTFEDVGQESSTGVQGHPACLAAVISLVWSCWCWIWISKTKLNLDLNDFDLDLGH